MDLTFKEIKLIYELSFSYNCDSLYNLTNLYEIGKKYSIYAVASHYLLMSIRIRPKCIEKCINCCYSLFCKDQTQISIPFSIFTSQILPILRNNRETKHVSTLVYLIFKLSNSSPLFFEKFVLYLFNDVLNFSGALILLFTLIAPKILKFDSNLYNQIFDKCEDILFEMHFESVIEDAFNQLSDWNESKENEYSPFKYLNSDFIDIIREDNLTELRNRATHPEFDFNLQIDPSLYPIPINILISLIDLAAFYGSKECFVYLLANGSKLSSESMNYAICSGELEIIRFLQAQNIDYAKDSFEKAIEFHHFELFQWIISMNDSLSITDYIVPACLYGNLDVIRYCVEEGIDINSSYKGCSLLHHACFTGNIHIIHFLLSQKNINIEVLNIGNNIPLDIAIMSRSNDCAKLLLKKSNINHRDDAGITPLHRSVYIRNFEMLKVLMEDDRIDANIVDNNGESPFSYALLNHDPTIFEYLLDHPKINLNDKDIQYAINVGQPSRAEKIKNKLRHTSDT